MKTALIIALVVLWVIFMVSVLLMSPKGWIGLWIGGASAGWNEYWSKKSIEGKLKLIALISAILFVGVCIFLPFVA